MGRDIQQEILAESLEALTLEEEPLIGGSSTTGGYSSYTNGSKRRRCRWRWCYGGGGGGTGISNRQYGDGTVIVRGYKYE